MSQAYIGRIAPSPTGLLHLGHAATFWTAYKRAVAANGTLLLRNEDLDAHRSRPEFVPAMLEDLAWLGIKWAPPVWTQSERVPVYKAAFDQLVAAGLAYPCTCSRRDISQMMHAPHEDGDDEPVYPGRCRPCAGGAFEPLRPNTNYRFLIPDGSPVSFDDRHLGPRSYVPGRDFGDFLIWRKDGLPSYQLACVVDDAAMGVTEVVRGADLLKSTARQILLQRALGLPGVAYFHTPLVVDERGNRLAKRHDALAIQTLRERGLSAGEVLALAEMTL
jgi:glutamyl-queuosine tRNA(Asp) synthetase